MRNLFSVLSKTRSVILTAPLLLLLTAVPATGQVKLGLNGGLSLASVDVSSELGTVPDFESATRMSLGGSVTFPLTDTWGLQVAGGYAQKGGKGAFSEDGVNVDITLEADYFEFAALGVARFPLAGDRVSAHLLAGPAVALEASCNIASTASVGGSELTSDTSCDNSVAPERSSFDLGVAGGGGIEIGLTDALGVSVGALYTFGLLDIDDADTSSLKHRALNLRVGLVYSLPR